MGNPPIPVRQEVASGILHHRLLVVLAGKAPDRIQPGEERDRGEHNLVALIAAQQTCAAETVDCSQMLTDLRFRNAAGSSRP